MVNQPDNDPFVLMDEVIANAEQDAAEFEAERRREAAIDGIDFVAEGDHLPRPQPEGAPLEFDVDVDGVPLPPGARRVVHAPNFIDQDRVQQELHELAARMRAQGRHPGGGLIQQGGGNPVSQAKCERCDKPYSERRTTNGNWTWHNTGDLRIVVGAFRYQEGEPRDTGRGGVPVHFCPSCVARLLLDRNV